jgi:hypothetical protein
LKDDIEYLKTSIENHLPIITQLEVKNKELEDLVQASASAAGN